MSAISNLILRGCLTIHLLREYISYRSFHCLPYATAVAYSHELGQRITQMSDICVKCY